MTLIQGSRRPFQQTCDCHPGGTSPVGFRDEDATRDWCDSVAGSFSVEKAAWILLEREETLIYGGKHTAAWKNPPVIRCMTAGSLLARQQLETQVDSEDKIHT